MAPDSLVFKLEIYLEAAGFVRLIIPVYIVALVVCRPRRTGVKTFGSVTICEVRPLIQTWRDPEGHEWSSPFEASELLIWSFEQTGAAEIIGDSTCAGVEAEACVLKFAAGEKITGMILLHGTIEISHRRQLETTAGGCLLPQAGGGDSVKKQYTGSAELHREGIGR